MSSNLKVNSLVPATGTAIGIGTTGGTIDFRCPATFGGNVTIGGTLTYDEVINIDSIGIVTARSGLKVTGGQLDVGSNIKLGNAGVVTATSFSGSIAASNIDSGTVATARLGSGTANNTTTHIFKGDGDIFVDGSTTITAFDDYDDVALLTAWNGAVTQDNRYKVEFKSWVDEHKDTLESLGIIAPNPDGTFHYSIKNLNTLMVGAIRQLGAKVNKLEEQLALKGA